VDKNRPVVDRLKTNLLGPPQMSTASLTRRWLGSNPSVSECFDRGLLNLSQVAREILTDLNFGADETDRHTLEGVLAALKRLRKRDRKALDRRIREICEQSSYHVRTRRNIYILEPGMRLGEEDLQDAKHLVRGEGALTVVFDRPRTLGHEIRHFEDVAEIVVTQPEEVETTPGVSNFILSTFRVRGINLLEFFSCYNETIVLISKSDIISAVEALDQIIG
jgi:hypothetical protein